MTEIYDIAIIGGGATGLGVAVEAASRGYKTILFESHDFGKGTSSKSTKLVHGGIRYLANFDFKLVKEGLTERYSFINNAPHIAKSQPYLIPFYSYAEKLKYLVGIYLYDFLAGKYKIGKSKFLNKAETIAIAPHLNQNKLIGSAVYYDGQFDDTRMLVTLMKTFESFGGEALNYHNVIGFIKDSEYKINGLRVLDEINQEEKQILTKLVVNATGTFTNSILNLDEPGEEHNKVTAAQGTHLVFNADIFPSNHAILIPKTNDDRVLFILPWRGKIVVGTTDISVKQPQLDPQPLESEIDFILETINQYSTRLINRSDIKSMFAGQRPLVKPEHAINTAKISRNHEIILSMSNLITIVGGKWTIYRKMAEDTINFAIKKDLLSASTSMTKSLKLFGYTTENLDYPLSVYGTEYTKIKEIQQELDDDSQLHPRLPYFTAEIIYQVRFEKAKTLEDILARRTRALFLDAKAAIEICPKVAKLMAKELNMDSMWIHNQIEQFRAIAAQYVVKL
ncbi:MAG: glycerol-3-phosphate dehydrogenase/oxidase [Burkholderiales bacterium]|nr:glycerol-3-phosphate dehydrogenase/oxidase [Burkholderiales bacterium]